MTLYGLRNISFISNKDAEERSLQVAKMGEGGQRYKQNENHLTVGHHKALVFYYLPCQWSR